MLRKTAICWLTALALGVVASATMSSLVAQTASAASTDRGTGFVIFVPAHVEPSPVRASNLEPTPVVSSVETPHGWWGYCCTGDHSTHNTGSVPLLSPWGPAPMTANSNSIEQYLFNQINHDRAIRGLYLYSWNPILANGARLHSWNMAHCGFSHSCPDGDYSFGCMRITYEFPHNNDCGECISAAGSDGTLTNEEARIGSIQEGMVNEPDNPSSWHRIHLTSQTLHSVGVGVYVTPGGWVYATEDMLS
ncbi:MAG: CAP domain-containing protein [Ktedonobacteraceae bacterium]